MTGFVERITDKTLKAWLGAGPTDRGIGGGLTFVATAAVRPGAKPPGSFATDMPV